MASCTTPTFGNANTCPRVTLEVNITTNAATSATLSWALKYYAGSAAQTSVNKSYTAVIAGQTVATGTYNINGKTGTHTIKTGTKVITKGTSAQNISFSCSMGFNLTWSGTYGGTKSASENISVPAKTKYTISYNANGGSGAPPAQTKWAGTNITISTTKPTRTGYTFAGWSTSPSGSVTYSPGVTYSTDASVTLYAIWSSVTYTVSYNANGGSGAPSNQTKAHGVNLILSSTKPTKTNYNFLGWSTSATSNIPIYQPGDTYSSNSSVTLYAVWQLGYTAPRITGLTADRCNSSGALNEEGTYAKVSFKWEADYSVNSIKIEWKSTTASSWQSTSASASSKEVSKIIGGNFDTETEYNVRVTVQDSNGKNTLETKVSSIAFELDFLYQGGGVSIGKPATKKGFEVNYPTTFENTVVDQYGTSMITGLAKEGTSVDPNTTLEHVIVTNRNTPNSEMMYVVTYFHGVKSTSKNRIQSAYPYSGEDTEYLRHYASGSWTSWKKVGGGSVDEREVRGTYGHKCYILKNGNVCQVSAYLTDNKMNQVPNTNAWNAVSIIKLPSDCYPRRLYQGVLSLDGDWTNGIKPLYIFEINTDGNIKIVTRATAANWSSLGSGHGFAFSATYITK